MNPHASIETAAPVQSATTSNHFGRIVGPGARMLFVLLILAATVAACSVRHVRINGSDVIALDALTAGKCAAMTGADLRPGNLYDISGDILIQGGGISGVVFINGHRATVGEAVHSGDTVRVIPGHDATEPLKYRLRAIAPVIDRGDSLQIQPSLAETGVGGFKYVSYGAVSGKVHGVRLAAVTPAPPEGKESVSRIALTFDDGPNPTYTPRILEILQRHNAHATFFTVGTFAKKYPDIVQQILDGGSEVACHTWGHPDCTKLEDAQVRKQLSWWKSACPAHENATVRWFRPPYGATSGRVKKICWEVGYRTILWTGDTHDWTQPGVNSIYTRALQAARDGACILMHDGGGPRSQTVAAVKKLIPELQRRSFQLVTLSELYGYEPAWNSDFLIQTETGTLRLREAEKGLQVRINGEPVELPIQPVQIDGQLLLPARPTLQMLGCQVSFDKPSGALTILAPTETIRMNLNSCTLAVGGREIWMAVPPVFFRGHSMIPLWLLMEHCGATGAYDPLHTTLHLRTRYGASPLSLHADNDSAVRVSLTDDAPWHDRLSVLR